MNAQAVMFESVSVRYEPGARCAVEDVSFSVVPGERVGLVGLNGSGKTTLLMAAVGLVPHEGTIRVGGATLSPKTLTDVRDRVGFLFNVPEDQLLFPKVIDDVAFGLVRRGTSAREAYGKATQVLDSLGVASLAEAPLHHLSHGQKQRVALAGALVTDPPVLLLDEPSAGLDPPARRGLVRMLVAQSAAMLVATHDFDFAARLCTRFVMLDQGRVAFDGANLGEIARRWESDEGA